LRQLCGGVGDEAEAFETAHAGMIELDLGY
jgi:hypothetical protein